MDLKLVLRAHSSFAAVSGGLAVFVPSFFGGVFPSLSTPDTLAFVVRMYAVLLMAQAPLLYGIRNIETGSGLRPFCAIYACIFGGTAIVSAHSDLVLGVIREENQWYIMIWAAMCMIYAAFATWPSTGVFALWSLAHMLTVTCIGLVALTNPAGCNIRHFLVPNVDAYNTVSRYYGVLILGMSLLAAVATNDAARPLWPSLQLSFSTMFAVSGVFLALLLLERAQLNIIGAASVSMFAALSLAYVTARLTPPTQHRAKGQ